MDARSEGAELTANEKVGALRRLRLLSARGGEVRWLLTYRTDAPGAGQPGSRNAPMRVE